MKASERQLLKHAANGRVADVVHQREILELRLVKATVPQALDTLLAMLTKQSKREARRRSSGSA